MTTGLATGRWTAVDGGWRHLLAANVTTLPVTLQSAKHDGISAPLLKEFVGTFLALKL